MLISALLILSFNLITSALQHEKSFMFDSTASSVFAIALYKRSLLITSSNDVIQKDIETGIFQRKFVAHSSIIESILVVNGTTMITTGGDDMVIVWDLISGSIMRRIWLEAPRTFPSSMAIKNSDLFVSGRDGKVRIVNLLSGRVATRIDLEVSVVAIRVKDNHFYVGKQDTTSQFEKYSIPARSLLLSYEGHQSSVFTLFLHGAFLFSGSFDSTIICWNEENGQIIRIYSGHSTAVWVIAIIDDYLYSASEPEGIFKWNIDSGAIENIFPVSHLNTIYCFAFESGTLYSGSTDTTVIRWDLRTSSKLFTYGGRKTRLRALVLWKNVVLAAGDGPVLTIQDKSQNTLFPVEIISGHESGVLCMIMINDTFFTGGVDATIRRRSFIDFSDIKIYNGHSLAVSSLVLDEDYMYSGSYDFTLKQWNIASGSIENDYIGHERDIWSIQVQGQFLYSGSLDSSVMIWDKESAAMVKAIDSTEVYLIYIYDEVLIVVHESLDMVSLSAGETIARQEESFSCTSMIASMYRIFSGHDDGVIRARDPLNLNILEYFQGHNDNVMSVWFDDAGVLFSAGFDGSVKKWDMASRKVSFSYENRNGSVTALATVNGILSVGTREGTMHLFDTRTAFITNSSKWHQGAVTALAHVDGIMYSSGIDGKVLEFYQTDSSSSVLLYDSKSLPITTMALNTVYVIALQDVIEIVLLPRRNSSGSIRRIISP